MADIVLLRYDVDIAQVLKGDQALDKLTASTLNADKATKTLGQSSLIMGSNVNLLGRRANRSSRVMGGFSNTLRQTSLQLSQVGQQAAANLRKLAKIFPAPQKTRKA